MSRVTRCAGSALLPCPQGVTWVYRGVGVPRKRCADCMSQVHQEDTFMANAVLRNGMSEQDAEIAMRLHFAKRAVKRGDLSKAMRLTRAAMESLGSASGAGMKHAAGGEG